MDLTEYLMTINTEKCNSLSKRRKEALILTKHLLSDNRLISYVFAIGMMEETTSDNNLWHAENKDIVLEDKRFQN